MERGFWNTHRGARLDREPNVGVPSISQSTEGPSEPKHPAAQTAKRRRASSSNSPVSRASVMMLNNSSSTAAASALDAARPRHAVSLPGLRMRGGSPTYGALPAEMRIKRYLPHLPTSWVTFWVTYRVKSDDFGPSCLSVRQVRCGPFSLWGVNRPDRPQFSFHGRQRSPLLVRRHCWRHGCASGLGLGRRPPHSPTSQPAPA